MEAVQQQIQLQPTEAQLMRENRLKLMKLQRLKVYNEKLQDELKIDRIKASNSSLLLIDYVERTRDNLLPEVWGPPEKNQFAERGVSRHAQQKGNDGCCTVM